MNANGSCHSGRVGDVGPHVMHPPPAPHELVRSRRAPVPAVRHDESLVAGAARPAALRGWPGPGGGTMRLSALATA